MLPQVFPFWKKYSKMVGAVRLRPGGLHVTLANSNV